MNNTFDFSYFVPTPDTTANCALSRWNDGLMGLSDFLKLYMSSRQSLEFGFSRNLNIKELLNLAKDNIYDDDNKYDYVINYRKFGDVKAHVCGFEIPILDFSHPFLFEDFYRNSTTNEIKEPIEPYKVGIAHVYNYNSNLSKSERVDATIDALNSFKVAIQDQKLITDEQLHIIFKKANGQYRTRQRIINEINNAIDIINNLSQNIIDFTFGFDTRDDLESISESYPTAGVYTYLNSSNNLYRDYCCNDSVNNPNTIIRLYISENYKQEFQDKFLTPFGISFSYIKDVQYVAKADLNSHILLFFKFNITEKPSIVPFISHDGTIIPTSEQKFSIQYYLQKSVSSSGKKSYWDDNEECPVYFDVENNPYPMTLESNLNGMGGRDYTFWSSPVQKTESGYQFECCMPLAFYNSESDSYGNEYYSKVAHDDVEIGESIYRVPVVKRMRQNIEEAIVNTHLTKCLNDLVPANNENAENDDTVVLGGVVVDDFTEGLYSIAESQKIASEDEYGEVKIVKVKDSQGQDNGILDLMYHYSETGELEYNGMTMPETGRSIDMITLFDVLKKLNNNVEITDNTSFASLLDFNNLKDRTVTTHNEGNTGGDNQSIKGVKYFQNTVKVNELVPYEAFQSVSSIGKTDSAFNTGYFNEINVRDINVSNIINPVYSGLNIGRNNKYFENIYVSHVHSHDIVVSGGTGTISLSGNIIPTSQTSKVGTSINYFDGGYFSTIIVNSISPLAGTVNDTISFESNISVGGNINVSTDNMYDLGSSQKKIKDGYFSGTITSNSLNINNINNFPTIEKTQGSYFVNSLSFGSVNLIFISYTATNPDFEGLKLGLIIEEGMVIDDGANGTATIDSINSVEAETFLDGSVYSNGYKKSSTLLSNFKFKLIHDINKNSSGLVLCLAYCVGLKTASP